MTVTEWIGDPFIGADYWADQAEQSPMFLIEDFLTSTANTISGRPSVGKTRLAAGIAAAVAGGSAEFAGFPVNEHGRVGVVSTDAGEAYRWGTRMREAGLGTKHVAIARFELGRWDEYLDRAIGSDMRLMIVDNLTGALPPGATINDDDAARELTRPLTELTEHGITVMLLAHSGKRREEKTGAYSPTGVMGSTVYQAWERLNLHIGDATAQNERRVTLTANDLPSTEIQLEAEWGPATATWHRIGERPKLRPRTETTRAVRATLFDTVASDPELSRIESKAQIGRELRSRGMVDSPTDKAAEMAFTRAIGPAGGVFTGGAWHRNN